MMRIARANRVAIQQVFPTLKASVRPQGRKPQGNVLRRKIY